MNYAKAFILKLLMIFVVLFLSLNLLFNVSLFHVVMLSLIISVTSFILGDFFILPAFENWGATLADFFLVVIAIRIYGMNFFIESLPTLGTVGLIALIISVGEIFYHIYIDRHFLNVIEYKDQVPEASMLNLQTEFSEELVESEGEKEEEE